MNILLIHNDNLPSNLINQFDHKLKFDVSLAKMLEHGFSFDKEAHRQLEKALSSNEYDVIFLPYSLSPVNYLELTGLRIALHIRLTSKLGHTRTPIVFIGPEELNQIAKLSDYGGFLFTSGIFHTSKLDFTDIEKQYQWIREKWRSSSESKLSDEEYGMFLSKTKIDPPANYDSHHSIDNELALLRWSEYIGCDDQINEVKDNLGTGLYFKYFNIKNPVSHPESSEVFRFQGKAKVLLVDDEEAKGWCHFYENLFINSDQLTFDSLKLEYKNLDRETIVTSANEKIKEYDPEIVLLDLRLSDADFEKEQEPNKLSGVEILKKIKELNRGIQVIITTASNKVWNYEVTKRKGADGFIIKSGDSDVAETIENLNLNIQNCIQKAKNLKKIHNQLSELKELVNNNNELSDDFKKSVYANLDVAYELIISSYEDPKYMNYAYLQIFSIIEDYLREDSIFEEGDRWSYVVYGETKYLVLSPKDVKDKKGGFNSALKYSRDKKLYKIERGEFKNHRINIDFKMSAVLHFRFSCEKSELRKWSKINYIRNDKAAHGGKGIVTHQELENLVVFLTFLINKDNLKPAEKEKALSEPSFEEQIDILKSKFGAK